VYVPGFTRAGLVQGNKVQNCIASGYKDTLPVTESSWIDNVAILNGPLSNQDNNYEINFGGPAPVDEAVQSLVPTMTNKYGNLAIKKS
jgi:hypothetical protein